MKKKINKPMRAAGALLVATMLTTCMTAGTFAKYVTTDSATDSARVAKFGVTVSANGTLYGQEYKHDATNGDMPIVWTDGNPSGTVQINVSDKNSGNKVVAPGTSSDGAGLGFSANGTPEVDVQVTGKVEYENIYLKAGEYGVMIPVTGVTEENFASIKESGVTIAANGDTNNSKVANRIFTKTSDTYNEVATFDSTVSTYYKLYNYVNLKNDYYPVVYTLTGGTNDTTKNDGTFTSDSLAAIAAELVKDLTGETTVTFADDSTKKSIKTFTIDATTATQSGGAVKGKYIQANQSVKDQLKLGSEVLTWAWDFERTSSTTNAADASNDTAIEYNNADTILGDLMAKKANDSTFTDSGEVVKLTTSGNAVSATAPTEANASGENDYNLETKFEITIGITQVD